MTWHFFHPDKFAYNTFFFTSKEKTLFEVVYREVIKLYIFVIDNVQKYNSTRKSTTKSEI